MLHKNNIIPLEITALSSDGNGLGRHEGQVVFVPGTAPGDRLRVRIVKVNRRHAYGRIEQLVSPGGARIPEDCPISRQCGGCQFRQLDYRAELAAKHSFVADALGRIGGLDVQPAPTLPSPVVDRYRNKVQYPVAPGGDGGLEYGFYAERSHRVVPCADCLLQPGAMNRIAAHTVALLARHGATPYDERDHTGLVRHVTLRQSALDGSVLVCVVATAPALPFGEALAAGLAEAWPEVKTVVLNHNPADTNVIFGPDSTPLYGPGTIEDVLCGVPLRLWPHTFSQVNSAAAAGLFGVAARYAAPGPGDVLLDLYCGTGVIGLSMARRVKQLIGVELVPEAVESARRSAAAMGLGNTRFICDDAGGAAAKLAAEGLRPHIVLLDPPRKGADAATLNAILGMAPRRVVMVSCNPATAARDLAVLCKGGYRLEQVQPADLFPRTRHVECVCLLSRN